MRHPRQLHLLTIKQRGPIMDLIKQRAMEMMHTRRTKPKVTRQRTMEKKKRTMATAIRKEIMKAATVAGTMGLNTTRRSITTKAPGKQLLIMTCFHGLDLY